MDEPRPGTSGIAFLSGEWNISVYVIVYFNMVDLLVVFKTACWHQMFWETI